MGECNVTSQFPRIGVWWDFLRILKDFCVFYWKWHMNNDPQMWFSASCFTAKCEAFSLEIPFASLWREKEHLEKLVMFWCSLLVQLAWHTQWGKARKSWWHMSRVVNITFECHLKNVMVLVHNCKSSHAFIISFAWIKCNKIQYLSSCETVD